MEDSKLIKISIIIALLGTLIILLLANFLKIPEYKIKDISQKEMDLSLSIQGNLTYVKETQGLYILTIKDSSSSIQVVIFKDKQPLNFTIGSSLKVHGKVTKYRDIFQLIAEKIESNDI